MVIYGDVKLCGFKKIWGLVENRIVENINKYGEIGIQGFYFNYFGTGEVGGG